MNHRHFALSTVIIFFVNLENTLWKVGYMLLYEHYSFLYHCGIFEGAILWIHLHTLDTQNVIQ